MYEKPRVNVKVERGSTFTFTRGFSYITWARLFKGRITLSSGYITNQRISVDKTNHAIHWIVIYPIDSVIQFSNNRGLYFNLRAQSQLKFTSVRT